MIQPLSNHSGLLQAAQLSTLGGAEKPGEAEHDGDSDDGGGNGAAMKSVAMSNMNLPGYLGAKINTLA